MSSKETDIEFEKILQEIKSDKNILAFWID
jgi:hypothetical protein